jgi:hypothetical protein
MKTHLSSYLNQWSKSKLKQNRNFDFWGSKHKVSQDHTLRSKLYWRGWSGSIWTISIKTPDSKIWDRESDNDRNKRWTYLGVNWKLIDHQEGPRCYGVVGVKRGGKRPEAELWLRLWKDIRRRVLCWSILSRPLAYCVRDRSLCVHPLSCVGFVLSVRYCVCSCPCSWVCSSVLFFGVIELLESLV